MSAPFELLIGRYLSGNMSAPEFWPLKQGFDEYFGIPYSNDMWPYHPERPDA